MVKETIQMRPILIGTGIATMTYFVSYFLAGQNMMFTVLIMGGILVGYMIGGNIKNGAFNGIVMGITTGIINVLLLILMITIQGGSMALVSALTATFIIYILFQIILGAAGGVFGSVIRAESELDRYPAKKLD